MAEAREDAKKAREILRFTVMAHIGVPITNAGVEAFFSEFEVGVLIVRVHDTKVGLRLPAYFVCFVSAPRA